MRINHNLMAMNTNRQLGISNKAGAKSMEKLSSGFRINRAADDAAGLSISEKMRNQIRGLERASANSQDGISLIQTAEGALDESHAILKRMRELTVQAGNEGTLQQDDLEAIRDEFKELASELDGISDRTEFNGKKLLDGSYEGTLQIGANQKQQLDLDVDVKQITSKDNVTLKDETIVRGKAEGKSITAGNLEFVSGTAGFASVEVKEGAAAGDALKAEFDGTDLVITLGKDADGNNIAATKEDIEKALVNGAGTDKDITIKGNGSYDGVVAKTTTDDIKDKKIGGSTSSKDLGVKLSQLDLKEDGSNLEDVLKSGTFFGFEGMSQANVKTATDANLERLDAANKAVSKVRSHLGANQNRLEHTIKNLDNAAENIQASESRIRDVDMAKEMIENTKQNILQQASTAMLAQANQAPQTVLRLLG